MCGVLVREQPVVICQTHINENTGEIVRVRAAFPWAGDYLNVYDRFGLAGRRSVCAHNIHAGDAELARLAATPSAVSHCPCSNAVSAADYSRCGGIWRPVCVSRQAQTPARVSGSE
jgi:guanine deaminase